MELFRNPFWKIWNSFGKQETYCFLFDMYQVSRRILCMCSI